MSSNSSSRSPPTPTAPFLGPIELPYISGSSGSSRDNHYQLSQNSHRRPYAPLFVTLGSPVPVNTSAVGTAGALAGYAGGNGSVSGSTGSGSARQSNVYTYGLATPPTSPTLTLTPLLRISQTGFASLIYNTLNAPTFTGPNAILAPSLSTTPLNPHTTLTPACDPPLNRLTATILYGTHPAGPVATFAWSVSIKCTTTTNSRTSSASCVTIHDVLFSLHSSLQTPVAEHELAAFNPEVVNEARRACARRVRAGAGSGAAAGSVLVRSDFLQGCVWFAGMSIAQGAMGSVVVRLTPRLH